MANLMEDDTMVVLELFMFISNIEKQVFDVLMVFFILNKVRRLENP
jgi:hypothetical protein